MGRAWRIEYEGGLYHVLSRGNERKDIFHDDHDRLTFLDVIGEMSARYHVDILAYTLMSNHYHILLRTNHANLSKSMQWLGLTYTRRFNNRHFRSGHLFQGRFKSIIVQNDAYLMKLSCYIHRNPLRAGMVEKPEQYKWSSYRDYINLNKSSKWLCTDFILSLFSRKTSVARKQYRRFVESMADVDYESPFKNVFASTIPGGRSFINQIREKHLDRKKSDRDLPDLKQFYEMPDLEEIIKQAAKVLSEDAALLKRVQIYMCHKFSGQKLKDIGFHFGIGVSGVSQASRRVALQIKDDKKLKKKIDKIILDLTLSIV